MSLSAHPIYLKKNSTPIIIVAFSASVPLLGCMIDLQSCTQSRTFQKAALFLTVAMKQHAAPVSSGAWEPWLRLDTYSLMPSFPGYLEHPFPSKFFHIPGGSYYMKKNKPHLL